MQKISVRNKLTCIYIIYSYFFYFFYYRKKSKDTKYKLC